MVNSHNWFTSGRGGVGAGDSGEEGGNDDPTSGTMTWESLPPELKSNRWRISWLKIWSRLMAFLSYHVLGFSCISSAILGLQEGSHNPKWVPRPLWYPVQLWRPPSTCRLPSKAWRASLLPTFWRMVHQAPHCTETPCGVKADPPVLCLSFKNHACFHVGSVLLFMPSPLLPLVNLSCFIFADILPFLNGGICKYPSPLIFSFFNAMRHCWVLQ